MKLTESRMCATRLQVTSPGTSTFPIQWPPWILLMLVYGRAKDVVAAMIKRLAHRNANVQLYTLEVGREAFKIRRPNLTCAVSLRTPYPKIADFPCTESWHPEALQMPSCD
jgi:hypothetical protein